MFFLFLGSDSPSQLLPGFPSLDFHWEPPRSPQEDRPKKIRRGFWKVDPLGNPILQFPGSLRALDQPFVQQRLPLQLPRATGSPQGAHKRTDQKGIFVFFFGRGWSKSRPSWGAIWSTPWPAAGFAANIRSTNNASRAPRDP